MHAARAERVHLLTDKHWAAIEQQLVQSDLFQAEQAKPEQPKAKPTKQAAPVDDGDDWI
jgi:hypothetical protein